MLKFYDKYSTWQKAAKREMKRKKKYNEDTTLDDYTIPPTLDPNNFTLLEDFRIESRLAINKSNFTQIGRGSVEIVVKASPVNFNLNEETYNHLVNIHRCFTFQEPEEIATNMINAKKDVLNKAILISEIKKRGESIKTWTDRVAILSGSYVYIYRESSDLVPEYYFFLKDAIMYDQSDQCGERYALQIRNKFGSVLMSYESLSIKETWLIEIAKIVATLNFGKETNVEIQEKLIEEEQKQNNADIFNLQLECPSVCLKTFEMDTSLWFEAELKPIKMIIKKPVVGFRLHLGIGGGIIKHRDKFNYFEIIAESRNVDGDSVSLAEVQVLQFEKPENPSGDEIDINVKVGSIYINFFPPFIKKLIRLVRNMRYIYEYDFQAILDKKIDEIKELEGKIIQTIKDTKEEASQMSTSKGTGEFAYSSHHCDKFPFPYILFKVSLIEIECSLLHHHYATPFVTLKVGETTFDYDMFVDHHQLKGTLGCIRVSDMTNYPYTYNPKDPKQFENGKSFEVLGLQDSNEKNTLSFE